MICWFKALWPAIKRKDLCDLENERKRSQGWEFVERGYEKPRTRQSQPRSHPWWLHRASASKKPTHNYSISVVLGGIESRSGGTRRNKEQFAQRFSETPITKTMREKPISIDEKCGVCFNHSLFRFKASGPATKQPWYRTIYSHVLQLFTTNQAMQHKKLRFSSRRINFR